MHVYWSIDKLRSWLPSWCRCIAGRNAIACQLTALDLMLVCEKGPPKFLGNTAVRRRQSFPRSARMRGPAATVQRLVQSRADEGAKVCTTLSRRTLARLGAQEGNQLRMHHLGVGYQVRVGLHSPCVGSKRLSAPANAPTHTPGSPDLQTPRLLRIHLIPFGVDCLPWRFPHLLSIPLPRY